MRHHSSRRHAGAVDNRRGFTLIEAMTVVAVMGIMLSVMLPKVRVSPQRKVALAARQLMADLDLARTRALASKQLARMAFDVGGGTYVGFLDDDGDGAVTEAVAETRALRGFGTRTLEGGVVYGRGAVPGVPGVAGSGAVTFPNSRVEFSSRGITSPFGTSGAIYLTHPDDPTAVAAVSVSGSASFKAWVYRGGVWQ